MYRTLLGILVALGTALAIVGLTFSATEEGPADFTFINGTELKTLDPGIMTGQPEGRVADMVFEGLTFRDPKTLRPTPGMAASWDVSPDRLRWTFHLRRDVTWSDGTPFTAHDVAWSWRRLQLPRTASEYAYILHMVKWAEILNTYEGNAQSLIGPAEGDDDKPALGALDDLVASNPGGVTGKIWRDFVRDQNLNEYLKGVEDELLQAALSYQENRLTTGQMQSIRAALKAEGERRRALARRADEVFGVSEGVFARDDHTLVVELKALTPYFLDITAFYPAYPVPRHVVEQPENELDWFMPAKIVTNGPYRLVAWRVNDKIRLEKWDGYWNTDAIHLDVVDVLPTGNAATALNLYLTGHADWLSAKYPGDIVLDLMKRDDFYANDGYVVYYYRFNTTEAPFDDPRVRHAICLGVNREELVKHVTQKGERPAYHFVPPGLATYDPPDSAIGYDPTKAKQLLAEAGFPGGKGLKPLGVLHNTDEMHKKIAENVAAQLKENLGIEIKAYNQEWRAYQQSVRDLEYDMARAGWIGDYLDPMTFLDMWVTNGGNNQTGWSNPLYDRLILFGSDVERFIRDPERWIGKLKEPDVARALLAEVEAAADDPAARAESAGRLRMHLLREAEALLVQDEFPVLPIYYYVVSGLVKADVGGFHTTLEGVDGKPVPNLQDIHPVRGMWMKSAAEVE